MIINGRPYTDEWSERDKIYFGHAPVDDKLSDELPAEKLEKAKEWVAKFVEPRRTVNNNVTSYGIKHMIENYIGEYITNNQGKDIMLQCGYEPVNSKELNWRYKIKLKAEQR